MQTKTRSSSMAFMMFQLMEKIVEKRDTEGFYPDDIEKIKVLEEFLSHLIEKDRLDGILKRDYDRTLDNARKELSMPF